MRVFGLKGFVEPYAVERHTNASSYDESGRYESVSLLISKHNGEWAPFPPSSSEFRGDCLVVADTPVMNLVIKQKRNDKPTYESLVNALKICKAMCEKLSIRVLAMPAIACVDDSLYWSKVKPIIKDIFSNMDIDITVCLPPRKKGRPPHEPEEEDYAE